MACPPRYFGKRQMGRCWDHPLISERHPDALMPCGITALGVKRPKTNTRRSNALISQLSNNGMDRIRYDFELWQGGMMVARTSAANREDSLREIQHYAAVYAQDGPVEIRERGKKLKI